jgi:hypothetical protein
MQTFSNPDGSPQRERGNLCQSRFGFHPCDYATYRQLKTLHRAYWQAVYDFHCWHRWWRKRPENRRGPEPQYCKLFVTDELWYKPVVTHGVTGFKVYPKKLVDREVLALYRAARMPAQEPVEVWDAETLGRIEAIHREWSAMKE